MTWSGIGVVPDLMATTESGHGHIGVAPCSNSRKQTMLTHRLSDVIMLTFVPEGASHAATARINHCTVGFLHLCSHGIFG